MLMAEKSIQWETGDIEDKVGVEKQKLVTTGLFDFLDFLISLEQAARNQSSKFV